MTLLLFSISSLRDKIKSFMLVKNLELINKNKRLKDRIARQQHMIRILRRKVK